MIQVPADVAAALRSRSGCQKRLKVSWTLNDGSTFDITKRIPTGRVGRVSRSIRSLLDGYEISAPSIEATNHDGFFDDEGPDSAIANHVEEDLVDSTITIYQEVLGKETGWYEIPVHTQAVNGMRGPTNGIVEFRCYDPLSRAMAVETFDEYVILPTSTPGEHVRAFLDRYTQLADPADFHTADFAFADGLHGDLDWAIAGSIPAGESAFAGAQAIARSGLGQIYPDEFGKVRYSTEFPIVSGQRVRPVDFPADRFDETNAVGWDRMRASEMTVAEVVCKYSGVSARYKDSARAGKLKFRQSASIDTPFMIFMRQAEWGARLLYESVKGVASAVKFSLPSVGLQLQVDDRVLLKPPWRSTWQAHRLLSKSWTRSLTEFEAMPELHYDTILNATLMEWGSTSWGDTTAVML